MSVPSEHGLIAAILYEENGFLMAVDAGARADLFTDHEALALFKWCQARFAFSQPIDLITCGSACHGQARATGQTACFASSSGRGRVPVFRQTGSFVG